MRAEKQLKQHFPLLRKVGLPAEIALLPQGSDPDTYLRHHGKESLGKLLEGALGIVEFLIDDAAEGAGADPSAKASAISNLGPVLAQIDNAVELRLYYRAHCQAF